jgi:hypothetical protein
VLTCAKKILNESMRILVMPGGAASMSGRRVGRGLVFGAAGRKGCAGDECAGADGFGRQRAGEKVDGAAQDGLGGGDAGREDAAQGDGLCGAGAIEQQVLREEDELGDLAQRLGNQVFRGRQAVVHAEIIGTG